MKRDLKFIFASIILFIATFLIPQETVCKESWGLLYQPRQRIVKSIGIYNDLIFIGTGNGVFVSKDKGKIWTSFGINQLSKDRNGNSYINWIYIDKEERKIYIATSFGAYYSDIYNPEWKKFFLGTKDESNLVNSLTIDKNTAYLSTNDGFWICNINESNQCNRLNQGLEPDTLSGVYETFYSLKDNDDLFLGTSNGIYSFNKNLSRWENISNGIQKLPNGRINARHLLVNKEGNLYASTGSGTYLTSDKGKTWKKISEGIGKNNEGFQETFYIYEIKNYLFLATAAGVYYLDKDNTWKEHGYGIRTKEGAKNVYWINGLKDNLFAATDEGLFVVRRPLSVVRDSGYERLSTNDERQTTNNGLTLKGKVETDFANLEELEPSVIEVQKQALKFASLPNTKDYKRYRTQARLRNLVPRVGFDINTTGNKSGFYELEKGLSTDVLLNNEFDTGRTTRLQRDGRSFKQLSVLWNTNQFVYDDEIREILNQARLTANIKENLLDDVTRIYFQRRKLQLENILSPVTNIPLKLTKELEIAEFTGQLDSRTGGWFSREIERRKTLKN